MCMTFILYSDYRKTLHDFVGNFVFHFFHLTKGECFFPNVEIVCYFTVRGVSCF